MKKSISAGVGILHRPETLNEKFGIVSSFGPIREKGFVRFFLSLPSPWALVQENSINITMPEDWALEFVRVIYRMTIRLQEMRALHKIGWLAEDATYDSQNVDDELRMAEEGDKAINNDSEFVRLLGVPVSPRPATRPHIVSRGISTGICYTSNEGVHVRITCENPDSIRIERAPEPRFEVPPGSVFDPTRIDTFVVENSRWRRERYSYIVKHDLDPRPTSFKIDLQHYFFQFGEEVVEVLAEGFWVELSDSPFPSALPDQTPLETTLLKVTQTPYPAIIGAEWKIEENPLDQQIVLHAARLGSQLLYRFTVRRDGAEMIWTVCVRYKGGSIVSLLRARDEVIWINEGLLTIQQAISLVEPLARSFFISTGDKGKQ